MIQVKAMENREEERKLLDAAGVEGRVLSMKDGGQEVGYAIVDLQEGTLLLRKLAAKGYDFTQRPQGEELFILDTLMRSAASWGEDHGADAIATSADAVMGTSTVTTTVEHDLTGASGSGDRTLEGTVVTAVKTAADGETETVTTTLTPAMKLSSAQEGEILTGTVALEEMTGKNVTKALTFTFDEEPVQVTDQPEESVDMASAAEDGEPVYDPMPQSSLSQNEEPVDGVDSDYLVGQPPIGYQIYEVPDTMQTYDLDTAQADQLEALRGELYQNLAGRLLAALAKLPAEDAALLADNLSEEDYAAFLELAQP